MIEVRMPWRRKLEERMQVDCGKGALSGTHAALTMLLGGVWARLTVPRDIIMEWLLSCSTDSYHHLNNSVTITDFIKPRLIRGLVGRCVFSCLYHLSSFFYATLFICHRGHRCISLFIYLYFSKTNFIMYSRCKVIKHDVSWVQQLTPPKSQQFGRLRWRMAWAQESEFQTSLGNLAKPCLPK